MYFIEYTHSSLPENKCLKFDRSDVPIIIKKT